MHLIDASDKRNMLCVSQEVLDCMQRIPPIDPENLRLQGEWECEHETWGKMQCSICKKEALLEKANGDVGQILLYVTSNYCPNCGAKMKGAGEDA